MSERLVEWWYFVPWFALGVMPWILVWIGLMTFDSTYRAAHGGDSWSKTLGAFWGDFWITAFIAIGAVTIDFAVLERVQAKSRFLEKWDPLKLPAVRDPNQIPRSASIVTTRVGRRFSRNSTNSKRQSPLLPQRKQC